MSEDAESGHNLSEYQFQPGRSGNPGGRPKGRKNTSTLIREAVLAFETETGRDLFMEILDRSFKSDKVLMALLPYVLPKLGEQRVCPNCQTVRYRYHFI